jgi:ABC-type dipeptide/oligopeptide/nickel transport system permease component
MSGSRGCLVNSLVFLVIVFVPIVGHILATVMALDDDRSFAGKLLWIAIIWLLPPWVILGPLLYLLFGQRPRHYGRVMLGQSNYPYQQQVSR